MKTLNDFVTRVTTDEMLSDIPNHIQEAMRNVSRIVDCLIVFWHFDSCGYPTQARVYASGNDIPKLVYKYYMDCIMKSVDSIDDDFDLLILNNDVPELPPKANFILLSYNGNLYKGLPKNGLI